MDEQLIQALEDPTKLHYKELWLAEEDQLRRNVLELFAFGTLKDKPDDMTLTSLMQKKLQKLSIVSLSELRRELTYTEIQHECQISDIGTLEELLIELRHFFEVKLDSVRQVATIGRLYDCREVYCNEQPLQLVQTLPTTKQSLLQDLHRWKDKLQTDIIGE